MTIKHDYKVPSHRPHGIGKNVYLLGTSVDGPYMEPMHIRSKEHARKIYGDETKGTLVKAFDEVYDRNRSASIYLMRISGESSTYSVWGLDKSTGEYTSVMEFYSIDAGEVHNDTYIELHYDSDHDTKELFISTADGYFSYVLTFDMTLSALSKAICDDCRAGRHRIMMSTRKPYALFQEFEFEFEEPQYLSGGSDGTQATRDELYLSLDLAYSILLGRAIDVIVPVDVYVDDVHPAYVYGDAVYGTAYYSHNKDYLQLIDTENGNRPVSYHEQLIEFCREQISLGYMTHGVIGLRPLETIPHNIHEDDSYIQRLIEATAFKERIGFLEFVNGAWFDKGFYISVVASELIYHQGTPREYYANGATRYASILSGHFETTTNLEIGEDAVLRYELSTKMRARLAHLGIVTFRDSVRLGQVVHSGVTTALASTDYHHIGNVRMVQIVLAHMNEIVEIIYESYADSDLRRYYLEELVKERLKELKDDQILLHYDYSISYRADDKYGAISLTLQTKYSTEGIQISTDIKPAEE